MRFGTPRSAALTRRSVAAGLAVMPAALAAAQLPAGEEIRTDIAVIGAGVFGSWIAWHLARAGRGVVLVDAYGPANARASSGGESRVIRADYGGDRLYSDWAARSLPVWQALSQRHDMPLFHRTGVLWMTPQRDERTEASLATLSQLGVRHETLSREALAGRYPQIALDGIGFGLFEPDSGALMARRAVQTVVAEAVAAGARLVTDAAGAPVLHEHGVGIPLAQGGRIEAGHAVYACGPWLPQIFPDIVGQRIRPTRQSVFYFGAPAGDRRFAPPAMPVWADFNAGDIFYGLPDLESRGFKIAHDAHGPDIDPDTMERLPTAREVSEVRAYLARRFPALADAPLVESRVCQYENTSSGDFLIDRHPQSGRVWLAGGGSGHGFKHGPMVGAYVAGQLLERDQPVEPRFALASKAIEAAREVY